MMNSLRACKMLLLCVLFCDSIVALSSPKAYVRFLESNSWVFKLGDVQIFSDPVMSQLDFGIPLVYSGNKRYIDGKRELSELARSSDVVLISQGFDDHAHTPTLKELNNLRPDMPYICPPSAVSVLNNCGISSKRITTLLPGQKYEFTKGSTSVEIYATEGALLGPPWQQKENGYILKPAAGTKSKQFPSLYYEPHCMYDEAELARMKGVDYVITPVVKQLLPAYTLVDGGDKALKLAQILEAKYVIPMMNGELEQSGVLASIVRKEGSVEEFEQLVKASGSKLQVITKKTGEEIALV